MNVLIDTNIFYEYYGRKKLFGHNNKSINDARLYTLLNCSNTYVSLSSVSVVELIVRLKDEPKKLKDVMKFIIDKDIYIKNHAIYNFDFDDVFKMSIEQESMIKFHVKPILKAKSKSESSVGIALASLLLETYFDFYFEREELRNSKFRNLKTEDKEKLKLYIHDRVLGSRIDYIFGEELDVIHRAICSGYYSKKKDASALKNSKEALNFFIGKHIITITAFADNMIKNYINESYHETLSLALEHNKDVSKFIKDVGNINRTISSIIKKTRQDFNLDFFRQYNESYIERVSKLEKLNKYQIEYSGELITSWMNKGVKAEKNDVLDFLILGGLEDEIFLTLDKAVVNYLNSISHKSIEYIDRLRIK